MAASRISLWLWSFIACHFLHRLSHHRRTQPVNLRHEDRRRRSYRECHWCRHFLRRPAEALRLISPAQKSSVIPSASEGALLHLWITQANFKIATTLARFLVVCAPRDDEQVVPKFVNSSPRSNEGNQPTPRRCSIVRFPEHHKDATRTSAIRIPNNGPPSF